MYGFDAFINKYRVAVIVGVAVVASVFLVAVAVDDGSTHEHDKFCCALP